VQQAAPDGFRDLAASNAKKIRQFKKRNHPLGPDAEHGHRDHRERVDKGRHLEGVARCHRGREHTADDEQGGGDDRQGSDAEMHGGTPLSSAG